MPVIDAPKVSDSRIITNDIAEIGKDGRHFRILGRKDNVIDSRGHKNTDRRSGSFVKEIFDRTICYNEKRVTINFGEVVAILVESDDIEKIKKLCEDNMPKYWQPKIYISVEEIPRTQTGKPARRLAAEIAENNTTG